MRFDLHAHSECSDGTFSPATVIRLGKEAGLQLVALTDHDTIEGVPAAMEAGRKLGIHVLPGVEMDTESPFELHMLGLGFDINNPALNAQLLSLQTRRKQRNAVILEKFKSVGIDISAYFQATKGVDTRLHIAMALHRAGYAKSVSEAFHTYLDPGTVGYYTVQKLYPEEAIALIHQAGGIAVLAHPCHIKANAHQVVERLAGAGLDGLEAYYPTSSEGQTKLFESLAAQFGLLLTCGSDFHGENRKESTLGCAWREIPALARTANELRTRHPSFFQY